MEQYDYLEAVKDDVKNYIENEIDASEYLDRDELENYLNDTLFVEDSVTGNGSGSYFFNTWKAEEAIAHNLDLLAEAVQEFGDEMDVLKSGAEACDVTIRCYVLGQAIGEVLDEMEEELTFYEDLEEEEEEEEINE